VRILVVEDETSLRAQLEAQLRKAGYAVDSAADGEDGFYLGRETPFDLAVVDLGLPKLSGIEVIQRWRAAGRRFPVLILTARGRWQDKVEGLNAGADDYLAKPFQSEELHARINALLRRAAGVAKPVLRCGPITLDIGAHTESDKLPRIFEAYYTTKSRGTGLGLAIVKNNVELYGGSVRAESELGKGTRFTLVFPAKAALQLGP
jgi:two-component system response regulator PhoP